MQSLHREEKIILAYCKVCRQTLKLPIQIEQSYLRALDGRLCKCTCIHEGSRGEPVHALLIDIDQNFTTRRTEVTDLFMEHESELPRDSFNIQVYCQMCQRELEIPISTQNFDDWIKTRGFYLQTFVHGEPSHSMVVLLDASKEVKRAEITNLKPTIVASAFSKLDPLRKEGQKYIHTDYGKMEKLVSVFEMIIIFDRRSEAVTCFFTKAKPTTPHIMALLDEITGAAELSTFSVLKEGKSYFFAFSREREVCTVGVNLSESYQAWLLLISKVVASEKETPNSLGLEIILRLMRKDRPPPKASVLRDLLFSPAYSMRMPWKYEEHIERVFEELYKAFPNTAPLFYPCAAGWLSILEALKTGEGLEHFDDFIELITYVDRRGLL